MSDAAVAAAPPEPACGDASPECLEYLRQGGDSSLAWSTLQRGLERCVVPGAGYVAFARWAGARLVLGDPVGPSGERERLLAEYLGRHPASAFVATSEETARLLEAAFGFRATHFGHETEIRPATFSATGRSMQNVRTACNKLQKEGVRVAERTLDDATHAELRAVSEAWMAGRTVRRREMAFLNRPLDERLDRACRAFVAEKGGEILGFLLLDPCFRGGRTTGWAANACRQRADVGHGLYLPLVLAAIDRLREEGVATFRLGLSPLAPREDGAAAPRTLMDRVAGAFYRYGGRLYNFAGVTFAKSRLGGERTPVYLCHRASLPVRTIVGLLRVNRVV
jgi:lysylphosphatidylglycerol synthetase-like protein (DUF2156 family)